MYEPDIVGAFSWGPERDPYFYLTLIATFPAESKLVGVHTDPPVTTVVGAVDRQICYVNGRHSHRVPMTLAWRDGLKGIPKIRLELK